MNTRQADDVAKGVGRAAAGALLFALPIFMTMEVWRLALAMPNTRIALLIIVTVAAAVALSYYYGIRQDSGWREASFDAGIALLVGFAVAGLILWLLSIVGPGLSWRNALSIIALEALPATIGASFARGQLGDSQEAGHQDPTYSHELFFMTAGAAVFAANVAPTEEVVLIAGKISEFAVVALVIVELAVMHAFVYALDFRGGSQHEGALWSAFARFTVVGYVIAFAVSTYLLWSFGRFDGTGLLPALMQTVVLCLPASVGAAAARLIL